MVEERIQRQTRHDIWASQKSNRQMSAAMERSMLHPNGRKVRRPAAPLKSGLFCGGLGREGLGLFRELCESGHVLDGHVREDFAVDGDACSLQAMNELPVGQTILASGSADTLNPQTAVLALFHAAIAFCVAIRAIGGFLCGLVELTFGEEETFRPPEILLAPSPALGAAFYAWHGFSPSYVGNQTGCVETRECASGNGFVSDVICCGKNFRPYLQLRWHENQRSRETGQSPPLRAPANGAERPAGTRSAAWHVLRNNVPQFLHGPSELNPYKSLIPGRFERFAETGCSRAATPEKTQAP
jgi:hypothetical protein